MSPCDEEEVLEAERRLGIEAFPPSFRSYLLSIGQFMLPIHSGEEEMLPLDEVAWFRVGHEDWIKAYEEQAGVNGDDNKGWPVSHLRNTLQISSYAGEVVFLLDTCTKTDGERELSDR